MTKMDQISVCEDSVFTGIGIEGMSRRMWEVKELFVLSDLHLAAERSTGLFQSDAELADCLRWVLTESEESLTILAGDTLDFLISADGETNTDFVRLNERTQAIIDYHSEVFEALSNLVQSPKHRLVIMSGDHDAELVFPTVQEAVERRLGLDVFRPAIRWLVQGEAFRLRVGSAVTLIEHGNVLDPWNRTDHATLQGAFSLASRNLFDSDFDNDLPPPGRRLALEVISKLRRNYRWIDCLKPETETVLPLVWLFGKDDEQKLISSLADEYLSMKEFAVNKKLSNSHSPEILYMGEKEAEYSEKDKVFKQWVGDVYEQLQMNSPNGKEQRQLIEKLRSVSADDNFFEIDQPDDSITYLQPAFKAGADLIIHGHTHAAKAFLTEGGFYINTGTWGQLLPLPNSHEDAVVWQNFLDRLRTNDVISLRRPTFARICQLPRDATQASLLEWQSGPKTLTTRRFSNRETGWQN